MSIIIKFILKNIVVSEYETKIRVKEIELQSLMKEINRQNPQPDPGLKKALDDAEVPEDLYNQFIKLRMAVKM